MKAGRLQAFSYCPTCENIRPIRAGMVTYRRDCTRIQGTCRTCGTPIDIVGRRHPGLKIGSDKRRLN